MEQFELKIKILTDILEKKTALLNSVLNITINQQAVLVSENSKEELLMFKEMNQEKQNTIEEIIKIDEVFNSTFNCIKHDFDKRAKQFKTQVKYMQSLIHEVETLDTKIRLAEERNKLITKQHLNIRKQIMVSKQAIADKYKQNYIKK